MQQQCDICIFSLWREHFEKRDTHQNPEHKRVSLCASLYYVPYMSELSYPHAHWKNSKEGSVFAAKDEPLSKMTLLHYWKKKTDQVHPLAKLPENAAQ